MGKELLCSDIRFYDQDLTGCDVSSLEFYHARIYHSCMKEIAAPNANMVGARLDHSDFSDARFTGTNFWRAEIISCNFRNADLQGCDFREVLLRGGDFRGANLLGAIGLTVEQIQQAITDVETTLP